MTNDIGVFGINASVSCLGQRHVFLGIDLANVKWWWGCVGQLSPLPPTCAIQACALFLLSSLPSHQIFEGVTWVLLPGSMALVPLVYIQVKAHLDYGPR
jgi:hypothetical protein